eukprot:10525642-Heterocapsa_arctica.AAC.1
MDPDVHFSRAIAAGHPCFDDVSLDPVARFAIKMQADMGCEVVRWRSQILQEVRDLVEDLTPAWHAALPVCAQQAYGQRPLSAPALAVILE